MSMTGREESSSEGPKQATGPAKRARPISAAGTVTGAPPVRATPTMIQKEKPQPASTPSDSSEDDVNQPMPAPTSAAAPAGQGSPTAVASDTEEEDERNETASPPAQRRRLTTNYTDEELKKAAEDWQESGNNKAINTRRQTIGGLLHDAVSKKDLVLLAKMLKNGWRTDFNADKASPLVVAVKNGSSFQDVIDYLIEKGTKLTPEVFAAATTQAREVDWIAEFFTKHYHKLPSLQQKVDCGTKAFCTCMKKCNYEVAQRLKDIAVTLPTVKQLLSEYATTLSKLPQQKATLDWLHELAKEHLQEEVFYSYLVQNPKYPRALEACDHLFDTIKKDRDLVRTLLSNTVSNYMGMQNKDKARALILNCINTISAGSSPLDSEFIEKAKNKLSLLDTDQTKLIELIELLQSLNPPPLPPASMPMPIPTPMPDPAPPRPRVSAAGAAAAPALAVQTRPAASQGAAWPRPMTTDQAIAALRQQKATEVSQITAELSKIKNALAEYRHLSQTPEVTEALSMLRAQEQHISQRLAVLSPQPHPTIPAAAPPLSRPPTSPAQHQPGASAPQQGGAPTAPTSQSRGSASTPGQLPTNSAAMTAALNCIDPKIVENAKIEHLQLWRATIQKTLELRISPEKHEQARRTLIDQLQKIEGQLSLPTSTITNTQQTLSVASVQSPKPTPQLSAEAAPPAQGTVPAASSTPPLAPAAAPHGHHRPPASSIPSWTELPASRSQRPGTAPTPAVATVLAPTAAGEGLAPLQMLATEASSLISTKVGANTPATL